MVDHEPFEILLEKRAAAAISEAELAGLEAHERGCVRCTAYLAALVPVPKRPMVPALLGAAVRLRSLRRWRTLAGDLILAIIAAFVFVTPQTTPVRIVTAMAVVLRARSAFKLMHESRRDLESLSLPFDEAIARYRSELRAAVTKGSTTHWQRLAVGLGVSVAVTFQPMTMLSTFALAGALSFIVDSLHVLTIERPRQRRLLAALDGTSK